MISELPVKALGLLLSKKARLVNARYKYNVNWQNFIAAHKSCTKHQINLLVLLIYKSGCMVSFVASSKSEELKSLNVVTIVFILYLSCSQRVTMRMF